MRDSLLILLLCSIFTIMLNGQELTSDIKVLDIPQSFVVPEEGNVQIDTTHVMPGNHWEVFSDRTFNKSVSKAGGRQGEEVLEYLHKYYVIEIKKDYLHIVQDPGLSKSGHLSKQAKDFGWVHKDKVLLWKHCLVAGPFLQNKRIFLLRNINTEHFFKEARDHTPFDYQIAYIFKETKNEVLLAKSPRVSGIFDELNAQIIGWVSKSNLINYSEFLFLEENWGNNIDNYEGKIASYIFMEKRDAKAYHKKCKMNPAQVIWNKSDQLFRKPMPDFRFPVLTEIDIFIKTIVISNPDVNENQSGISSSTNGFCTLSTCNNKYQQFVKVLLLSKSELSILLSQIELLYDLTTKGNDLNRLDEFYGTLNYSPDNSEEDKNVTNTSLLRKYYLNPNNNHEITLTDHVPTEQEFTSKLKMLDQLYNSDIATDSFNSNGIIYFWIPLSYLP